MLMKNKKKKLLIYAHYYVPDVASTGQLLCELAEEMLDVFDITIICTVPSYEGVVSAEYKKHKYYRENINGVNVLRIRVPEFCKEKKMSRIRNIVSYFCGAMIATYKVGKQDYVFSISQPPILGGLLGVWGKWAKRAKFIYNIQDFNPEQVMAVNYSTSRIVTQIMLWCDKFSCRRSDLVITVGRDLVQTMHNRFKNKRIPRTIMINNWTNENTIYPLSKNDEKVIAFKNKYNMGDKFIFMYSGNIGLYYDLENIIKVIESFSSEIETKDGREVVFAFVGAGSLLNSLKEYVQTKKMDNVRFIPYQDKENLIYSLNAADVHWVVNAKGIKGVSCPSKYYGVAATGLPILGVLEGGSEIRMLIEETNGGLIADPQDYKKIKDNIQWFIDNADTVETEEMGKRSRTYLVENLTKKVSVKKYIEAILEC